MKKLLLLAVVMIVAAAFVVSCGPRQLGGQVKGESFKTEGWLNDETLPRNFHWSPQGRIDKQNPEERDRERSRYHDGSEDCY